MQFSLATLLEHPLATFTHQVRTSTLAIELCQSVLGIDIADVVEDALDLIECSDVTRMALTQPDLDSPPETAVVLAEAAGYSNTLEYAIDCLPAESTLQLIQEGAMPSVGAPLTYATGFEDAPLVKALLDAGADVNARNWKGWTVLHEFSRGVLLEHLKTLVEFAEDKVNWMARTPDGRTALQIAKESPWICVRTHGEVDGVLEILRAYIPDDEEEGEEVSMNMPGAFPKSDAEYSSH